MVDESTRGVRLGTLLGEEAAGAHLLLRYSVRLPWEWVFLEALPAVRPVNFRGLFSVPRAGDRLRAPHLRTATLRFELLDPGSMAVTAMWCSSPLLDCVRNKDLLHLSLERFGLLWAAPPTVLMPSSPPDILSFTLPSFLPTSSTSSSSSSSSSSERDFIPGRFVLKPPMGCQGAGIEFVGEASEVIPVLLEDAARAAEHATDALVGRHPRWVLQAHVASRLVCGGRKMHLRTHLLLLESPSAVQLFYHRRHEVRVAFASSADAPISDRNAQITNGAGGSSTLRCLLRDMPELCGVEEALEAWLQAFLSRLAPQLASNRDSPAPPPPSAPGVRFSQ